MKIGQMKQYELAEILEKEGIKAFKRELERFEKKKLKRGTPKGKYIIIRTSLERIYPPDVELYEKLKRLAETKKMKFNEYFKYVLEEHTKKARAHF